MKERPFLAERCAEDLIERLGDVRRRFAHGLLVGALDASWPERLRAKADRVSVIDPQARLATRASGSGADEAALPFETDAFDLVVAAGTLDTADDLPGALVEFGRVLKPDGLLIGALPAAGSLPRLRAAMLAADAAAGGAAPRLHPSLDARTMGDLLGRAGFVLTVVDVDRLDVGYGGLPALVRDLRAHAATNVLARRSRRPLGRSALAAAEGAFAESGRDGRTYERFELLHFSGWTRGPDQPQPARRGSATASLADALRRPINARSE